MRSSSPVAILLTMSGSAGPRHPDEVDNVAADSVTRGCDVSEAGCMDERQSDVTPERRDARKERCAALEHPRHVVLCQCQLGVHSSIDAVEVVERSFLLEQPGKRDAVLEVAAAVDAFVDQEPNPDHHVVPDSLPDRLMHHEAEAGAAFTKRKSSTTMMCTPKICVPIGPDGKYSAKTNSVNTGESTAAGSSGRKARFP